jgi:hypothetical protein
MQRRQNRRLQSSIRSQTYHHRLPRFQRLQAPNKLRGTPFLAMHEVAQIARP